MLPLSRTRVLQIQMRVLLILTGALLILTKARLILTRVLLILRAARTQQQLAAGYPAAERQRSDGP